MAGTEQKPPGSVTENTQDLNDQLLKNDNSEALVAKPKATPKAEQKKLITEPAPTDKSNKVKFEMVSLADARRMVKIGDKCWTEITQENGAGKKLTYFGTPDRAMKGGEKTGSAGRIWIEDPETKEIAHIVNKKDRKPM